MPSLIAPAKINLALHITGRRADGYHLLSSFVAFAEMGDEVEAAASDRLELEIVGAFAEELAGNLENNLIWRAARLLQEKTGVRQGARLRLTKNLPVASGIGGGSSDAAAAAILLNNLWETELGADELASLLLPLGADIPMCIYRQPALVEGVGEKLSPIASFPAFGLLLVNPGIAVPTAEVFARYVQEKTAFSAPLQLPEGGLSGQGAWIEWLRRCGNDLSAPAEAICPEISAIMRHLESTQDCLLARMSGSGATCFALYPTLREAENAALALTKSGASGWVVSSRLCADTPL